MGTGQLSSSFHRLFNLSVAKDILVIDMVQKWNNQSLGLWRRDLRGWEPESTNALGKIIQAARLCNKEDTLIWSGNDAQW